MPTILVVADQPDVRQRLCQIYLQGGFQALEAEDSFTAFTLAQANAVNSVVLSLKSHDKSLKTCSHFAHELNIPVVYLTHEDNIDAALDAGAAHVISSLHPRLLLHCTKVLLEAREAAAQRQLSEALRDTAAILNSTLEIDTVLDRILTLIQNVIPSELSTIYLIDGLTNQAHAVRTLSATYPKFAEEIGQVHLPVNEIAHLKRMVETKEALIIPDTQAMPSWVDYHPTQWVRSVLSVPLQVDNQVIGFIFLNSALPHAFGARESETLQIFANQASIAISNANRYEARSQHADEMQREVAARTSELEQKSSQLEAIIESIGEGVQGVLFADQKGQSAYSFSNSALVNLFGYHDEEIASLDQLRPEDVSENAFHDETMTIFNTVQQKGIWKGERRLKRKDGTVVDTGMVVTGLKASDGHAIGAVSIFRDLSQQKMLDAQKERFVGHAAQELRNPIAALKLRLHLL
jgi:PAS domain S-box-containing protein